MTRFFTLVSLLLILSGRPCFCQLSGSTFYGKQPEKYKGHTLKVIATPDPYMYYMLDKTLPWNESGNTYLPGDPPITSNPRRLFGKEFFVYEVSSVSNGNFVLEMKEVSSGDTVYYHYDPAAGNSFTMHLADSTDVRAEQEEEVAIPVDYCAQLKAEKNKFTCNRSFTHPFKSRYNVRVYKDINKANVESYSMSLYTTGSIVDVQAKGLILLLDNGVKISKPSVGVDVEASQYETHGYGDYEYSTFVRLSSTDRALLVKHRITDFRVGIFEQEVAPDEQIEIQEFLKCLAKRK